MKTQVSSQLSLGIRLRDDATFDNFYPGLNTQTLAYLKLFVEKKNDPFVYLWGKNSSGRSHLLQACCHAFSSHPLSAVYLPFADLQSLRPEVLENLESLALVCIDDIDTIAGDRQWEETLFHFYNRARDSQVQLLISANASPLQLPFVLPDLRSRLATAAVFQLHELSEEEKVLALQGRAHRRAIELPKNVADFLLQRCSRDMGALFTILEKLDEISFEKQRKLTIPFVKEVLEI